MQLRSGKLVPEGLSKKLHFDPVIEVLEQASDESFSDSDDDDLIEQSIARGLSVKPFVDQNHPAIEPSFQNQSWKVLKAVSMMLLALTLAIWYLGSDTIVQSLPFIGEQWLQQWWYADESLSPQENTWVQ